MTSVLATSPFAEACLALGGGLLFAAAYTALAALIPYYREPDKRKKRMEKRAAMLAVFGSLPALFGVVWDSLSDWDTVGSLVTLGVAAYVSCVLGIAYRERVLVLGKAILARLLRRIP